MTISHRVLGPGFAAEVRGLDLAAPLDPATRAAVLDLWMTHKVLVFPGQALDETALLEFTRPFGPLFVHVRSQFHSECHPEVMVLTNAHAAREGRGAVGDSSELAWHSDQSYTPRPVWGTVLHALRLPDRGGETCFADLSAARVALSADLEGRITGRYTRFSINGAAGARSHRLAVPEDQRRRTPDVSHPILRRHPYRATCSLYLSPAHAVGVDGMDTAGGAALLDALLDFAARPEFVYTHRWRDGDVLMWDNTQTMHRRLPFPAAQERTLIRTGFHLPADRATPLAP